jgi:MFS family permease
VSFLRSDTFTPLRYRNYFLLWSGQGAHAFALWGEQIARPYLIFFLIPDDKAAAAVHIGGIIAMRTIPQLFFGVFAGVISDWFDHRKILLTTKLAVITLSVVFAGLLVFDVISLWHVYVFSFLRGSFMAFDQPARQAMIANILPSEQTTRGIALMSATQNIMRIVGSSAGGISVAFLGLDGTFVAIALIYIGAVIATYLIRAVHQEKPAETGARAMANGLVEGAKYAWQSKPIRGILLMSLVYFTFGMSYVQVFAPLFAEDVMDIGPAGLGIMVSFTGAGALVGALLVASRNPQRVGLLLPIVVVAFGTMLSIFSLSTYLPRPLGIVIPFALISVTGILQTAYFSMSNAALLAAAPATMRGRVISLLSLDRAMVTAGASGAGFLTAAIGVQLAQISYGMICVVGGLVILAAFPALRAARMQGEFGFSVAGGHGAGRRAAAGEAPAASEAARATATREAEPVRSS